MKLSKLIIALQCYRMPFKRWLWLGTLFWILALLSIVWLLQTNLSLSFTIKLLIITSVIILMLLYQFATANYLNDILLRLHRFLAATRANNIEVTTETLNEQGEIAALFQDVKLTALSLTEYYAKANSIAEKNQLLGEAIKQSSNSIVITDLNANILFVNQAFCNITGYSTAEVIGKTPKILQSGLTHVSTETHTRQGRAEVKQNVCGILSPGAWNQEKPQ